MPECFSRPICRFAMLLNDEANEDERQRLLAYVTRLACADVRAVENARAAYIAGRMVRRMSFEDRLKVLEAALAIGRQADPFPADEVKSRMEAVQARATSPTSVPDTPLFAKIKSWFQAKAEIEPTS